jgi:hypothetical protein
MTNPYILNCQAKLIRSGFKKINGVASSRNDLPFLLKPSQSKLAAPIYVGRTEVSTLKKTVLCESNNIDFK